MKSQNETKWIDGRLVQGAFRQWLVDQHHDEALQLKAMDIIARYTLGYRKRYAYIKQDMFRMKQSTINRQVKKLKELGLIDYERTRGYTMYKILLPEYIENKTIWMGRDSIKKEDNERRESKDSWGQDPTEEI